MKPKPRSTPAGEHRPVLLREILDLFDLRPGMTVVDCTVGWAGHSAEFLTRIGPTGMLVGLDMDAENLPKARARLDAVGHPFHLHHMNFAGLQQVLAAHGLDQVDAILADLGMSSMQVDDPARGFSYSRDGALDMRMDRSRGQTAAQYLATVAEGELTQVLQQGDEPHARKIAAAIVNARTKTPIATTRELAGLIQETTEQLNWRLRPAPGKWTTHPAARTFQALRILVNRELASLEHLLRLAPTCLAPGGAVAIISFHSGEDRLAKSAFRAGREAGAYQATSDDPIRASWSERQENPRSRSAKLRWARKSATEAKLQAGR
ncbi:MAG: 16S rRNA (cytosine(1402)-N(4))-methyltransferase RsmH [Planctomycetes bacterium]|nr:16S rRNA (cytosine(1402)-N(4))-methyltransferase RsmH [Planctomycetota bacterium]